MVFMYIAEEIGATDTYMYTLILDKYIPPFFYFIRK